MEIRTNVHTILMLVGPTECGKTTFAREVLMPGLRFADDGRNFRANIQYVSSDQLRQEVLGYEYDKYAQVMLEASEQAFHLLYERLRMATSYPINSEFVIVDTTGLAEDFRERVREIAKQNNYRVEAVVFDYRQRSDYYASERSRKLISNHISRLKREVMGALPREGYDRIHKVRAKDFLTADTGGANPDYKIVIEDQEAYLETMLPHGQEYIVIGDVHECVDDLQGLLRDYGYRIEEGKLQAPERLQRTRLVLVGDWVDKGKQTREIVEFLYENRELFVLVKGNHEHFVSKYMQGELSGVDPELLASYFDSTQALAADPTLLAKFMALVSDSKPFLRYVGDQEPSFYVTHAPCRNKYIGKLDANSARHQRNFRLDREKPTEPQLAFLQEEAVGNQPYHLFGHIAAKRPFRIRNKIHLDTGSVHGNALTAVRMAHRPLLKSRKASQMQFAEELPTLFREERRVSVKELGDEERRRLRYCSQHAIQFISGTMPPADKNTQTGELESLACGLDYFRERGVFHVALQPKYMGSRCNVYLYRDTERCFAVSRNGHKIAAVELGSIYEELLQKHGGYMREHQIDMLLLDGELLPWQSLGQRLIERQFQPIASALETELTYLQQHGFEQAYLGLMESYEQSGFEQDQYRTAKSALSDKYGASVYQNYKHIHEMKGSYAPLAEHWAAFETYKEQMRLYAKEGPLAYKPFAVLKVVYEDGREELPDWKTSDMYRFLNEDECLTLDLADPGSVERAERFFAKLTLEQGMEGVVIKPEQWDGSTVPYMKVRNPDYLSIIYGYDYRFPHKYRKLLKQKSIQSKLRASLNEYRLGQNMLAVPSAEIAPENVAYAAAAAGLLFEMAQEREIDPRL